MEARPVKKTLPDALAMNRGRDTLPHRAKWTPRNCCTLWLTCYQGLRLKTFCETGGDVEAKALVIAMHHSLAEVEAETPGDTLHDVETEASADTLGDSLAEVKATKVGGTLADLESSGHNS